VAHSDRITAYRVAYALTIIGAKGTPFTAAELAGCINAHFMCEPHSSDVLEALLRAEADAERVVSLGDGHYRIKPEAVMTHLERLEALR
jgi:hypothetical protein